MQSSIFGQWIGTFEGACPIPGQPQLVFPGNATFNIESDRPEHGFACIDQGNEIHGSRKDFVIKVEGTRLDARAISTSAFDFQHNELISTEESVKRQTLHGKDMFYFTEFEITDGFIDQHVLKCKWSGNFRGNKVAGKFEATKLAQNKPSAPDRTMTWEQFKAFVGETINTGGEFLFRGQSSNKHRLNTSFHREGRYDLLRYEQEACTALVQHINAASTRQYDPRNPNEFGALLSLAQHHGFPTPLLDWSKSPYIAAFFALENHPLIAYESDFSRIYVFNTVAWRQDTPQAWHIADPRPVITPSEFAAHNNPRHLPQQSVHTYTNIEDPETWIRLTEKSKGKTYLTVIDIPRSERRIAMRDLAYMGVTAATMFPGLDGVCKSLKERFFPLWEGVGS